jgi:hypothetical protein
MFPSSTTAGGFWTHVLDALHVCAPVQMFVEPHDVPLGNGA